MQYKYERIRVRINDYIMQIMLAPFAEIDLYLIQRYAENNVYAEQEIAEMAQNIHAGW